MKDQIVRRIEDRFTAYHDLATSAEPTDFGQKLDVPKSKSLAEHFWCVIGARESYTRAIEAGSWQGFACSLEDLSKENVEAALKSSAEAFKSIADRTTDWSEERQKLLLDLMEHETMHEGQIIRLLYGLEKNMPESVKWA